jgi:hypothetical protein
MRVFVTGASHAVEFLLRDDPTLNAIASRLRVHRPSAKSLSYK